MMKKKAQDMRSEGLKAHPFLSSFVNVPTFFRKEMRKVVGGQQRPSVPAAYAVQA
jgi:hypothetical protein